MTEQSYRSDLAIPPGEYLDEVLEDMNITHTALAQKMGKAPQTIQAILQGKQAITRDTALQLEDVIGVPAYFWNNLESEYRSIVAQKVDDKPADDQAIMKNYWANQVQISEDYEPRATAQQRQYSSF